MQAGQCISVVKTGQYPATKKPLHIQLHHQPNVDGWGILKTKIAARKWEKSDFTITTSDDNSLYVTAAQLT
jgi:hypothetical protein